ncbi:MAG: nagA [Glaciihabitans sp.]|nr:nagA [Glaciihabitans sp.]
MSTVFFGARKLDARGQVDDFWMLVDGATIVATGSGQQHPDADESVNVAGHWLVPGFIDLHSHGGGGFSFDDGREAILGALAVHRAHGTTRSVISLVANPIPALCASLATIADLAETDPLVLGSHLEGPFLSPDRRGAHNADFLCDPEPVRVDELLGAARASLRQITIAPELDGAMEAIDVLVAAGVVVALGHSDAGFELAREAFDRGVRVLTHTFNAMPGIHHRAPGPVVAAFDDTRVSLELILDGEHVHPHIAALAFQSAEGRVALITDAMAAAGSEDGDYMLGTMRVTVEDNVATLHGTSTIAGSTLTQDAALRMAMTAARVAPARAVEALTLTPARILGLDHRLGLLSPGFAADAVILDGHWRVQAVWAEGAALIPPAHEGS